MFSSLINPLRLVTDLNEMIQLIEKLLTGTMHLRNNYNRFPNVISMVKTWRNIEIL